MKTSSGLPIKFPSVINTKYDRMPFSEIDIIQSLIKEKEESFGVKQTYLYQSISYLKKSYKNQIIVSHLISLVLVAIYLIYLVNNLTLSLFSIPVAFWVLKIHIGSLRRMINDAIYDNCKEDRVFLKFALSTELVLIKE
ncbi:MAG TPA: hypothetical protein PLX95_03990 [bacterium]|nr:hypothetical protein [bacterium]